MARKIKFETVKFDKITPGGQALGTLESGKKIFAWGVLPGETAKIQINQVLPKVLRLKFSKNRPKELNQKIAKVFFQPARGRFLILISNKKLSKS